MAASAKKAILGAGALTIYLGVAYGTFKFQKVRNKPDPPTNISDPGFQKTKAKSDKDCYTDLAPSYDKEIGMDEWIMGMANRRNDLVKGLTGKVLEVSSGTGRNLDYYPSHLEQLILSDRNVTMLQIAQLKYRQQFKSKFPKIAFVIQNAERLNFPDDTFDHVIDSFGLCSCEDPVDALKEMARVVKPGGTIRLLEHGRGNYDWMNEFLDKSAEERSHKWGCWWNRDIIHLVKEAGLKVKEHKTYHFGTTSVIIASK